MSDLCDDYGVQPSQIYRWPAAMFEQGPDAFDVKKSRNGVNQHFKTSHSSALQNPPPF